VTPFFNFLLDEQKLFALGVKGANDGNNFGHFKFPFISALIRRARKSRPSLFKID
jgi:hypothetical protein